MKNFNLFLLMSIFVLAGCWSGTKKSGGNSLTDKKPVESVVCCEKGPLNQLTDAEKAQGWQLLFDGTTSEGWRGYNKTNFPAAWVVEDGTLRCRGEASRGEAGKADGGDLIYSKRLFSDFDLRLEWKISEAGNSGIFYLAKEVAGWPIYKSGLEMQILDNEKHPDSFRGKDGNRKAGSLYDLIPAKPQNARPVGEWNSIEIVCYHGKVVHRQNGAVVLEYELWTPEWNSLVSSSKFPGMNPDWANIAKEGVIGLQDHGNDVWFRNIKIRVL
ncbi:MAG: DUF1080 domain-containing protein [Bacteroidia bacterium]|nr:DUF1080 domain-containing protein [Bacteroidia bacterium]